MHTMERYKITDDANIYFVTFSVLYFLPIFVSEKICRIITNSLNFCHNRKQLRINAYVIMPTHMHMIVFDRDFDNGRLAATISSFRQFTGRRLIGYFNHWMPAIFGQVMSTTRRTDRQNQFWQQGKHPVGVTNPEMWRRIFDYIHENPRRKGLVTDPAAWRFSSAGHWLIGPDAESELPLTTIPW
jgi:putative transposase